MTPKISIITVCLNEIKGIRQTCESIANQKYSYEWIVIDGQSTDGTKEVLNEFKDFIKHLVSERDNGIFDAMNKGIDLAQGEYLIFMNGGDHFASSEILESVANELSADIVSGDVFHDIINGPVVSAPDVIGKGDLRKGLAPPHQATFYRRSLFDDYGQYDTSYRIAGDYELYVRLFEVESVSYKHIAKPIAVFDLSGISNDQSQRVLRKKENHRVRMKYFPKYRITFKALRQILRNALS